MVKIKRTPEIGIKIRYYVIFAIVNENFENTVLCTQRREFFQAVDTLAIVQEREIDNRALCNAYLRTIRTLLARVIFGLEDAVGNKNLGIGLY